MSEVDSVDVEVIWVAAVSSSLNGGREGMEPLVDEGWLLEKLRYFLELVGLTDMDRGVETTMVVLNKRHTTVVQSSNITKHLSHCERK